jgi:hypothetical protein
MSGSLADGKPEETSIDRPVLQRSRQAVIAVKWEPLHRGHLSGAGARSCPAISPQKSHRQPSPTSGTNCTSSTWWPSVSAPAELTSLTLTMAVQRTAAPFRSARLGQNRTSGEIVGNARAACQQLFAWLVDPKPGLHRKSRTAGLLDRCGRLFQELGRQPEPWAVWRLPPIRKTAMAR